MKRVLMLIAVISISAVSTFAQQPAPSGGHEMKKPDPAPAAAMGFYQLSETQWKDGPGSLAPGAKFAVLEGDPTKEGPFVMRLWLPDGFSIQPHWHPKVERVTVLSGVFNLGMGEKFDKSATRPMAAGTFGFWPAEMRHFAWTKGETVIQLHGIGPWVITYVNPADDPRNQKK